MGNFKQHVNWALWNIILLQTIIIILLLEYNSLLQEWLLNNDLSIITISLLPILFIIGAIMPDIDLPKESKKTKLLFRYLLPFFFAISTSALFYSFIKEELLFFVIGTNIFFWLFLAWLIDEKSHHWGRIHSIGFGLIMSSIVWLSFSAWLSACIWAFFCGTSFFMGFINHLFCDQIYHDFRGKKWRDKRYALKLWSNDWFLDPLIRIINILQVLK